MKYSDNKSLRYYLIFLAFTFWLYPAYSQTWSGSGTTIYYTGGSVGIGTQTTGPYLLDVHGYVHSNLMFIADAPSAGNAGAWFRGASAGSGSIILQANSGSGAAFWMSGSSILKIGGSGSTEPTAGAINITTTGSVGVGTTSPANIMEVATNTQLDGLRVSYNNTGFARLHANSLYAGAFNNVVANGDAGIIFGTTNGTPLNFGFVIAPFTNGPGGLRVDKTGNILIGKASQTNTGYMLDVAGSARVNLVVVNTTGADYVFEPGYRLAPLKELETYVHQQHHLPGIAPAAQMQQEGVNLGDNQTQLLAKIEELTLYVIQQDKEMQALKEKIKILGERNQTLGALEQRIEKLEHTSGDD